MEDDNMEQEWEDIGSPNVTGIWDGSWDNTEPFLQGFSDEVSFYQ